MTIRPTEQEIQEYINSPALNQSKLKLLTVSPQAFLEVKEPDLFFEEKEHFVIGKGVDDYLTMGKEYFEEHYHLASTSKPTAVIMSIVQQLFQSRDSDDWFNVTEEVMLSVIEAHNYQPNWKPETKIKKVSEEGERYWQELVQSEGKQVLSIEQFAKIESIIQQLLNHPHTKALFETHENEDVYYQLPIYFEYQDIQCKALLDMVIVNHNTKEIFPYDIKTIGDYTKFFDYQCKKRRYDIQAAWYMNALWQWVQNNYPDYNLHSFSFIVASTTRECPPLEFSCHVEFINVGVFGANYISYMEVGDEKEHQEEDEMIEVVHKLRGINDLIEEYKWNEEHGWELDKEIEEVNGIFFLGPDFKRH